MTSIHSRQNIINNGVHSIVAYEFTNSTTRNATGAYYNYDIGKVCRQTDDNSYYVLLSVASPGLTATPTWTPLGGTSGAGSTTIVADFTTNGNVTLSGLGTQANGDWASSLTGGDLVFVRNNTNPAQNGVYVAASGSWTRDSSFSGTVSGTYRVQVTGGTSYAGSEWMTTVGTAETVGSTLHYWRRLDTAEGTGGGGGGVTVTTASSSATLTLVAGINLILCNTNGGAFALTLPASPPANAVAIFSDAGATSGSSGGFGINNLTINPASGQSILGYAANSAFVLDSSGSALGLTLSGTNWAIASTASPTYGGSSSGTPDTVSTNSFISYWPLTEASGSAVDSIGSNTLTSIGTVGSISNATANDVWNGPNARTLNGSTQWFSLASNSSLQTGDIDFTVFAAVYFTSLSNYYNIVGKDGSSSGQREYVLFYDHLANRLAFSVFKATDSGAQVNADYLGVPVINTWYFVLAWHDSVNDQVCIQVNGGRVNKLATGGSLQAASSGEFRIGHSEKFQTSFSLPSLPGRINAVGFAKRILNRTERETLWGDGYGKAYPWVASTGGSIASGSAIADATRVINAIEGTGVTLSATVKTAILIFFDALQLAGILDQLVCYYGFVGGTAKAHAINWINPKLHRLTYFGTLTHSSNGVLGDGSTGYATTQLDNKQFNVANHSQGFYVRSGTKHAMGALKTNDSQYEAMYWDGTSSIALFRSAKGANNGGTNSDARVSTGLTFGSYAGVTNNTDFTSPFIRIYLNGVDATTSTPAGVPDNYNPVNGYIFRLFSYDVSGATFSDCSIASSWIGHGLTPTQILAFRVAEQALQTALGRQV